MCDARCALRRIAAPEIRCKHGEIRAKTPTGPRFSAIFGIYVDLAPEIGEKPHKKSNACCISRPVILKCRAAYPYVMHTG
jgi:hypothetical protein